MTDPLKNFMQGNALAPAAFPPDSRYHGLDTARWTLPNGETVAYVRRRFVPPAENFATVSEHQVVEGDRPDNLAASYLGDPQQYWRLCDSNAVLHPGELVETIGRSLRITLPEGLPGDQHG